MCLHAIVKAESFVNHFSPSRSRFRPLPFILILSPGAQWDSAWMSLGINGLPLSWKLEQ